MSFLQPLPLSNEDAAIRLRSRSRGVWTADPIEAAAEFDLWVNAIRDFGREWRRLRNERHEKTDEAEKSVRLMIDCTQSRLRSWQPVDMRGN